MFRVLVFLFVTTGGMARAPHLRQHSNLSTSHQMFSNHVIQRHLTRENGTVSFYAMSDVPYTIHEMANFPLQIASLDEDAADFAIHLGGIQPQTDHCTQQAYQDMRLILDMSALPMFILPGALYAASSVI